MSEDPNATPVRATPPEVLLSMLLGVGAEQGRRILGQAVALSHHRDNGLAVLRARTPAALGALTRTPSAGEQLAAYTLR